MSSNQDSTLDSANTSGLEANGYREILETLVQAVWETDTNGQTVKDSPRMRAFTGQTPEQWYKEGWIGAVHPDNREAAAAKWLESIHSRKTLNEEFRMHSRDGEWRWTNIRAQPLENADGQVVNWIGIAIDITSQKKTQEALLKSQIQFSHLTLLSTDTLFKMSPDWSFMDNLNGFQMPASSLDANKNWLQENIPPNEQKKITDAIDAAIKSKAAFELEHQVLCSDGKIGWVLSRAMPLLDESGQVTEWFGTSHDITKRKLEEERQIFLLELSDRLRTLADPLAIQETAAELLGKRLGADRVLYSEIIGNGQEYLVAYNYLASPVTIPITGNLATTQFGDWLVRAGQMGLTMIVNDVVTDYRITPLERDAFVSLGVRAFISTPLNKEGKWVAAVKVHQSHPRQWTFLEISLVEEVAERTWAAVEQAKAEQALRENEVRLTSQKEAFQAALNGASLGVSLDLLISNSIKSLNIRDRVAFYILGEDGNYFHPVYQAGNMSESYLQKVEALASNKDTMPCELAVSAGVPDIVTDVYEEPRWRHCLDLAKEFNFRGCWSFPIETQSGRVVGTLVFYLNQPRTAASRDLSLANTLTQAAAIMISRHNEVQQRMQAVQAVGDSEKRLRLAIEATELATWEWDLINDKVLWNDHHFLILGLEIQNNPQKASAFLDRVHPEDVARITAELSRSIAEQNQYDAEFRIIRASDKAVRWMSGYGRVTKVVDKQPVRMSGVMFDITDKKQSEESLRHSEQRQRAILESVKDYAIVTLNTDRSISSWNAGAQNMMGYTEAEILGQSGDIFFVPEDRAKHASEQEVEKALLIGRAENERWHLRKDGSRFYGSGVTTALRNDAKEVIGVVKVMRDLTVEKQTEQALLRSQERLQRALRIPTVGILFFDQKGTFTGANDAFLTISGYSREEVESGKLNYGLITMPAWMARTEQALDELRTIGRDKPFEKQMQRPDGSLWWGLFAGSRLGHSEYVEFVLDITHRKKAEELLVEADRRKDEFLALLSHELRNPMATLSNTLMILELTSGKKEILPLEAALAMMRREVDQLVRLMDDLLDISRINQGKIELKLERLDFTALLREVLQSTTSLIDIDKIQLTVTLPETPLYLSGDATRLTQVVRNLLTNAAKFTSEDGKIWVELTQVGDKAVLKISDDGIGIPADQLEHIFGLFAQVDSTRTRSQGGLGLGLTLVREFVDRHGGQIEAQSSGPGKGSQFIIRLPLLQN